MPKGHLRAPGFIKVHTTQMPSFLLNRPVTRGSTYEKSPISCRAINHRGASSGRSRCFLREQSTLESRWEVMAFFCVARLFESSPVRRFHAPIEESATLRRVPTNFLRGWPQSTFGQRDGACRRSRPVLSRKQWSASAVLQRVTDLHQDSSDVTRRTRAVTRSERGLVSVQCLQPLNRAIVGSQESLQVMIIRSIRTQHRSASG